MSKMTSQADIEEAIDAFERDINKRVLDVLTTTTKIPYNADAIVGADVASEPTFDLFCSCIRCAAERDYGRLERLG